MLLVYVTILQLQCCFLWQVHRPPGLHIHAKICSLLIVGICAQREEEAVIMQGVSVPSWQAVRVEDLPLPFSSPGICGAFSCFTLYMYPALSHAVMGFR